MISTSIVISLSLCLVIGYRTIYQRTNKIKAKFSFVFEFREKFHHLVETYFSNYEQQFRQHGEVDAESYIWLTKNANKIQSSLGQIGVMDYIGPFQKFVIKNYPIVINTLPKFREGTVDPFDANSVDDCLLRYAGLLEDAIEHNENESKNPIIWFREGFQVITSIPLYLLKWFGLLSESGVSKVTSNNFYKILVGIGGLVAFISGLVTIIQGKEQTMNFVQAIFGK